MAITNPRNVQHQLTANMVAALEENSDSTTRLVDPITRLSINTGDLKNVQSDNINEVRYLRNTILQSNNVINKGTEVVKKADKINVKALGQGITLQKIITANSTAINESRVGYLRSAEAFINNFSAGIRRTEGGTLRMTEQLILTGQGQQSFRDVNKNLLTATGRNYGALGEFNDSILESADTYQMSTGQLLEGIKKLQGDINQFALFGPEVATNLSKVFGDVKGSFQGLGDDQIASFMKLFQGGLSTRPTRELLGIQQFGEDMARGSITADQTRAAMVSVGSQMAEATRGMEFDVAVATLQAMYNVSQQEASNLVMLKDIALAGPSNDKKLLATNEEQTKTLENQAQLANKYYEKIAPMTLNAVTGLMVPLLQISQAVNIFAATQGGAKSLLSLAGGRVPSKPSYTNFTNVGQNQIGPAVNRLAPPLHTFNKKGAGAIKNLTRAITDRFPTSMGGLFSSPVGVGLAGAGLSMAGTALGGEDTTMGRLTGTAGSHLASLGMVRALVPNLPTSPKLMGGGLGLSLAGTAVDLAKSGLGVEEKEGADVGDAMDVASYALKGAGMGSMFGFAGMAVGGALGGLYGLWNEYMEDDVKASKDQLDVSKQQLDRSKERMRAATQRSDFVLMGIVDGVRRQSENLAGTTSARSEELLKKIEAHMAKRNTLAISAATSVKGNLNED